MYIPPPASYPNTIHNTKMKCLQWLKSIYQMDSYRGSTSTYILGLSKIKANILGTCI